MKKPETAQTAAVENEQSAMFSRLLITLYKGVLYKERDEAMWRDLTDMAGRVIDHFDPLGLKLIKDDNEGYAYVAYPQPLGEADEADDASLPRLVAKRQLSFGVSLMLALLRKKMMEFDAAADGTRLIVTRSEMLEMMRPFLPESTNEAKLADKTELALSKVKELGFIRPLRGRDSHFEVFRILKAFINAQWLNDFDKRLEEYKDHGGKGEAE